MSCVNFKPYWNMTCSFLNERMNIEIVPTVYHKMLGNKVEQCLCDDLFKQNIIPFIYGLILTVQDSWQINAKYFKSWQQEVQLCDRPSFSTDTFSCAD